MRTWHRLLLLPHSRVPTGTTLTRGIYVHLLPGTLPGEGLWVERKWGTRAAPIIVASETVHRAVVRGLSLYNCRHVYFIGVKFVAPWDHPLHLASCVNILVRRWVQGQGLGTLSGAPVAASSYCTAGPLAS